MARKRSLFSTALQSFLITGALLSGSLLLSGATPEAASRLDAIRHDAATAYGAGQYEAAIEHLEQWLGLTERPHERVQVLLNLAAAYLEVGDWAGAEGAIAQAQQILGANPQAALRAALQEAEGKLHFLLGRYAEAFRAWEQAAAGFGQSEHGLRVQLHQVQALEKLGQHRSALKLLVPLYQAVQNSAHNDDIFIAQVYQKLAKVGQVIGDFPAVLDLEPAPEAESRPEYLYQALMLLEAAAGISQTTANPQLQAEISLALGDLWQATYYWAKDSQERVDQRSTSPQKQRQYFDQAIAHYQTVAHANSQINPELSTQAQLNLLNLTVDVFLSPPLDEETGITIPDPVNFVTSAHDIATSLATQTPNRDRFFAQINLAQRLLNYHHAQKQLPSQTAFIEQILTDTLQTVNPVLDVDAVCQGNFAQTPDPLVTAYGLLYLGELYEKQGQATQAQACTETALWLAQPLQDKKLLYQAQWQLGQLLAQSPKTQSQAVVMYESTIDTLDEIRADLVSLKQSEFRFSFRDEVEPVYRELMALLLSSEEIIATKQSDKASGTNVVSNLDRVTGVLEELQVATIEDYLRCDLSAGQQVSAETIAAAQDSNTAFIYPIFTQNRIGIIVKYYQGDEKIVKRRLSDSITEAELALKIDQFREAIRLEGAGGEDDIFKEMYQLFVEPVSADLANAEPETVVFGLDRFFQNIPVAAFYDGQKYLIEKYAIAINIGMPLYANSQLPRPEEMNILAAGSQEFELGQNSLPFVDQELNRIQSLWPQQSTILRDTEFTATALTEKIQNEPFSVVHLATHGFFSSSPNETHLLTQDNRLNLHEIAELLQYRSASLPDAIQLLVLSACETATGDKRAALGLAGIAVQTGSRSAIASLSQVSDNPTSDMMAALYQAFQTPGKSRAQALREAQLAILESPDPARRAPEYWSSFILIGNWQ